MTHAIVLIQAERAALATLGGDLADIEGVAEAIDRLLADGSLRSRLGRRARQAVSAYTYDAMVEAFDRAISAARSGGRVAHSAH